MRTGRTHSHLSVFLALAGNAFITVIKFIGFAASGSGAIFSEAIHSLADTLNQALLLFGLRQSKKVADDEFSYGYGRERFFWALISACGIFFLGAGITIYHGIDLVLHPRTPDINTILFVILAVAFVVESVTLYVAWKELRNAHPNRDIKTMLEVGDPATIAVLYEDGVAVLGVFVAFVSIVLSYLTGNSIWDALGSIIIGVLLGIVAIILIQKNRKYLIGMNIPDEMKERIIELLVADPTIDRVIDFKSSVLNVGTYHIKCEVEFNGSALMSEIAENADLREEYENIRDDYSEFLKHLVGYVGRVPRMMGTRIDEIERRVQKEIPEIRHIDIEIN